MAALFVFAAAVQYNDPDPVRWMALYLAAAGVALMAAMKNVVSPLGPALVGLVALLWAAGIAAGVSSFDAYTRMFDEWEMRAPQVEEGRETGGLLIVALWMAAIAARRPRVTRR